MPKKGLFILFEGSDGSGQTTQAIQTVQWLSSMRRQAIYTKEPTESFIGKQIRELLKNNNRDRFLPLEKQQLFIADRAIHVRKEIIPALNTGVDIVCDRYYFSTLAYGFSDGLDPKFLMECNATFPIPDAVIFLDVSPEICMSRIARRGEAAQHYEKLEKLKEIKKGYGVSFGTWRARYRREENRINGELKKEEVFEEVKKIVMPIIVMPILAK